MGSRTIDLNDFVGKARPLLHLLAKYFHVRHTLIDNIIEGYGA